MRKIPVDIGFDFYAGIAAALLVMPFKWLLAWFLAAVFHELFHCIAIYLCKGEILCVRIGISGAQLQTTPLKNSAEWICALAGPAAGFVLITVRRLYPELAVCAFIQSCFNLLPVFPMDGGRVLRCLCIALFRDKGERIYENLQKIFLVVFLAAALVMTFRLLLGPLPVIAAVILILRHRKIKISCKQPCKRVQ